MDNAAQPQLMCHDIGRMIGHESPDLAVMTGIRTMMRMTMSVTITQHIFFRTCRGEGGGESGAGSIRGARGAESGHDSIMMGSE